MRTNEVSPIPRTSPLQHEILRECLGIAGHRKMPHRNYYATERGHAVYDHVAALVARGLMIRSADIPGGLSYYHCTAAGSILARLSHAEVEILENVYQTGNEA